uniref:C2H2-type domain-containing protein n=1 Tax=Mycena chlorophos TaxID=658473 RepID=A0ABQ0LX64_MYCCL|nr:predicted protein [Mycena chlorophos]
MSAVVLDFGSDTVKAGEEAPLSVFPSVVARPRHGAVISPGDPAFYVGDEALSHRPGWTLGRPIEGGIVQNWDDMERLLAHAFRELNVAFDAIPPVLVAEPAQASPQHRTKLAQIIFEELSVPALSLQPSASLSLLSAGLTSGLVLESGDSTTVAVPIHESHILHDAIRSVGYAGQEITDLILHLLVREQGMQIAPNDRAARVLVEELKHRKCYVAANYHEEVKCIPRLAKTEHTNSLSYELPDGQIVTMGSTRFVAPEALFQPSILGLDQPSITHLIYGAISNTPSALHASLLGNVLLSGGNTLFPGFADRLATELVDVVPHDMRVKAERCGPVTAHDPHKLLMPSESDQETAGASEHAPVKGHSTAVEAHPTRTFQNITVSGGIGGAGGYGGIQGGKGGAGEGAILYFRDASRRAVDVVDPGTGPTQDADHIKTLSRQGTEDEFEDDQESFEAQAAESKLQGYLQVFGLWIWSFLKGIPVIIIAPPFVVVRPHSRQQEEEQMIQCSKTLASAHRSKQIYATQVTRDLYQPLSITSTSTRSGSQFGSRINARSLHSTRRRLYRVGPRGLMSTLVAFVYVLADDAKPEWTSMRHIRSEDAKGLIQGEWQTPGPEVAASGLAHPDALPDEPFPKNVACFWQRANFLSPLTMDIEAERAFCSNFSCCGAPFSDLHALFAHFEEVHRSISPRFVYPGAVPYVHGVSLVKGFEPVDQRAALDMKREYDELLAPPSPIMSDWSSSGDSLSDVDVALQTPFMLPLPLPHPPIPIPTSFSPRPPYPVSLAWPSNSLRVGNSLTAPIRRATSVPLRPETTRTSNTHDGSRVPLKRHLTSDARAAVTNSYLSTAARRLSLKFGVGANAGIRSQAPSPEPHIHMHTHIHVDREHAAVVDATLPHTLSPKRDLQSEVANAPSPASTTTDADADSPLTPLDDEPQSTPSIGTPSRLASPAPTPAPPVVVAPTHTPITRSQAQPPVLPLTLLFDTQKPPAFHNGKPKPFICPIPQCTKAYLNPNGLRYHLRVGTCVGERDRPLLGVDPERVVRRDALARLTNVGFVEQAGAGGGAVVVADSGDGMTTSTTIATTTKKTVRHGRTTKKTPKTRSSAKRKTTAGKTPAAAPSSVSVRHGDEEDAFDLDSLTALTPSVMEPDTRPASPCSLRSRIPVAALALVS